MLLKDIFDVLAGGDDIENTAGINMLKGETTLINTGTTSKAVQCGTTMESKSTQTVQYVSSHQETSPLCVPTIVSPKSRVKTLAKTKFIIECDFLMLMQIRFFFQYFRTYFQF